MKKSKKNEGQERRSCCPQWAELRIDPRQNAGEDEKITGYAAVFNSLSGDLGGFREEIAPGAFTRALAENHDVRALVDHDPSKILARSTSGTLVMEEDSHGLHVSINPADTSAGRDIKESIVRGDVSGMSFGFTVKADEWRMEDGENIRTLRDLDLFDVSVVTYPAYESSSVEVALRSLQVHRDEIAAELEDIRLEGKTASAKARLRLAENK